MWAAVPGDSLDRVRRPGAGQRQVRRIGIGSCIEGQPDRPLRASTENGGFELLDPLECCGMARHLADEMLLGRRRGLPLVAQAAILLLDEVLIENLGEELGGRNAVLQGITAGNDFSRGGPRTAVSAFLLRVPVIHDIIANKRKSPASPVRFGTLRAHVWAGSPIFGP